MQKHFAGIILAAGLAERFGSPKIMIDWHGEPLVRHVAKTIYEFDVSPLIVVVGAVIDPVYESLSDLPVKIVKNANYKTGAGSSFSTGVGAIQEEVDGVFIFLCDQPFLDKELVAQMKTISDHSDVLFPTYKGKPGHPVLWNSQTFSRIMQMGDGETGRSLRKEFKNKKIPWASNKITFDIDTPEDYESMINADND